MVKPDVRPTSLARVRYVQQHGGAVECPPVDVYAARNWRFVHAKRVDTDRHLDIDNGEYARLAQPLHWVGLVHSLLGVQHLALLWNRAVAMVVVTVLGAAWLGWWPAQVLLGAAGVAHSGRMVWGGLQWRASSVIVTDRRLICPQGVIGRSVASTKLARITDHTYYQSWLGVALGYGTLRVETGGRHDDGADRELVRWVRSPEVVDRMLGPVRVPSWG